MVSERIQIGVMCQERWAENLLYRRYYDAALSFARKLVGRHEDAEEITNHAMYKAMRGIGQYDGGRSRFITWLCGIVRNEAADYVKSPRNRYAK